jgi:hypothetical protein
VTEQRTQEHVYIDLIHTHHEANQPHSHSHHDSLHEHFVDHEQIQIAAILLLLFSKQVFDKTKNYIFLRASRIFRPPRELMNFSFIIYIGV